MVWGDDPVTKRALERSLQSIRQNHPELPVEILHLDDDGPTKGLLNKSKMLDMSPFRETLYLDADTVVLGSLDYGFRAAQKHGLACCICECPWASRYTGVEGDIVEYNTGVLFFTERARNVFDEWGRLSTEIDSSTKFFDRKGNLLVMAHADQASFAVAIDRTEFVPFVLPLNWNFRPIWHRSVFGPIRIWHDYSDVHPLFYEMNRYYSKKDSIIHYHVLK